MNLGQALGELQLRISELEAGAANVVHPCPMCERIRALLGITNVRTNGNQHMTPVAAKGISKRIVNELRIASGPLTVAEIAERAELDRNKVATNIPHLVLRGIVLKSGERGSYRYHVESA